MRARVRSWSSLRLDHLQARSSRWRRLAITVLLGAASLGRPVVATASAACRDDPAPPAAGSSDRRLAEADALARDIVDRGRTPGLSIAVVRGGRLVFSRGYGHANLETGTPVTPDTVFNIFSVTKAFTAAAVLQLHERGRLSLDDKVAAHLPDFPRGAEVTIRQLLSHSSGLRDYAGAHPSLGRTGATPDELVRLIARQPDLFAFEPGARQAYSNSNYVLLGRIIERVSGESYYRYLADSVFPRGGVRRTAVDRAEDVVVGRASGYARGADGGYAKVLFDISAPFAAGAIRSTAPDLARWFTALFAGCVVTPESVRAMIRPDSVGGGGDSQSPAASSEPLAYGLGIRSYEVDGRRALGPGGSWAHFSSKVTRYPDHDLLIVVLANTGGVAAEIERRISDVLLRPQAD